MANETQIGYYVRENGKRTLREVIPCVILSLNDVSGDMPEPDDYESVQIADDSEGRTTLTPVYNDAGLAWLQRMLTAECQAVTRRRHAAGADQPRTLSDYLERSDTGGYMRAVKALRDVVASVMRANGAPEGAIKRYGQLISAPSTLGMLDETKRERFRAHYAAIWDALDEQQQSVCLPAHKAVMRALDEAQTADEGEDW